VESSGTKATCLQFWPIIEVYKGWLVMEMQETSRSVYCLCYKMVLILLTRCSTQSLCYEMV